jgi:hypothetical protein
MEVMEDKWLYNDPTSVYYSDESEDDSLCQVSWATGMNTEIAIENGEHDWVIFKKKQARLCHVANKLQEFLSKKNQDYTECSSDPFKNDSHPYIDQGGYYGDNDSTQGPPAEICYTLEEEESIDLETRKLKKCGIALKVKSGNS